MARPKKEGLDYFPHDTDATGDMKIESMLLLYGGVGYAFYFMLLELIYKSADQELDISDAETLQILSRKLRVSEDEYRRMLNTALSRGLFDEEYYAKTGHLTSNGIKRRAFPIVSKREKSSFSYESSKAFVSDAETLQKQSRNDTKKRKEEYIYTLAHFAQFWDAYPKKKSKGDAEKAWKSLNPSEELVAIMLDKLAQATTCREWIKDGGQYIPYPATWLRAKCWEDEYPSGTSPETVKRFVKTGEDDAGCDVGYWEESS